MALDVTPNILGIILQGSVILAAILLDLILAIDIPKSIRATLDLLTCPFRNFLTIDDFSGDVPEPTPVPVWKARTLVALSFLECIGWMGYSSFSLLAGDSEARMHGVVAILSWGYATLVVLMKAPTTPPYILITFWTLHGGLAFLNLVSMYTTTEYPSGANVTLVLLDLSVSSLLVWISGTLPVQAQPPADNVAGPTDIPSRSFSCPEDSANLWSWCTGTFVEPIFDVATSRTLQDSDVWMLSPYFKHKNIFSKYLEYQSRYPTHSLLRFLLVSNSLDLILDIVFELWGAIIGFVPPFALQQILSALADPTPESRRTAYKYAFIAFVANLSFAQVDIFQNWHTRRCYERTRGQLFCAIHYKALKRRDVSGKADHDHDENSEEGADLGKVVNLMQGDTYAISQRFWDFSKIFAAPIRLVIALVFLYNILGWSAFSGVVIVIVAYTLNYPLAKYNIYVTRNSWKAKDARMNVANELLQNIRFLKFYGWENFWASKVRKSRERELNWRVKENIVDTAIAFIWTWIPSATALTSFLFYTLVAGQRLTVSKAFTSIALFSQLQEPMSSLPGQFFAFLHAYVSMQRIQQYLAEPEVPVWASSVKQSEDVAGAEPPPGAEIGFTEGVFEWHGIPESTPSSARFQLGPLDIRFPKGTLTLVSGATGSGKSALLGALLGELSCISGEVHIDKRHHQVAYCAQNAWLENATIRSNILFGSAHGYDEKRYEAVVEACALIRDLEVFDAGDMTEIGEKGITLSGGQRARIALARALYSEATCILLDDPLAAVDMHTAQHLVQNCFSGEFAQGRTIILVTHHISLCLPIASYLVELGQGRVLHQGSIQELQDAGLLQKIVEIEEDIQPDEPVSAVTILADNEADSEVDDKEGKSPRVVNGKLIDAEYRAEGRVSLRTYMTYIHAAGIFSWILTIFLMLMIRVINITNQVFLAKWGEAYDNAPTPASRFATFATKTLLWDQLPPPDVDVRPWLAIYLYISIAGAATLCTYIALGYYASLQASRSLFIAMLNRLVRAPARFFDVTPIGRILNRFTSDINTVDGALQNSARAALSGTFNFVASFLVIIWVVPKFAPFALVIAWLYIRLAPRFVAASRDLRRLESVSLSPAFAGFDELLRGLPHIRAFGMESRYQDGFYTKVDKFQGFDHVYWLVSGWLQWRYDCLGSVVVFLTTVFALWTGVSDGFAALVIVQAGVFADASRLLVRVAAQLELDFNSVERIIEYLDVPQEAPPVIENCRPPAYWPSTSGSLEVRGLVVRYAPDLPAVLHHLSFSVKPSEKIGVVGRTGSGKSTLALSLLRMVEASEGRIIIDGIDISTIGLEDLRTRITIVSQDVSLFSGTLRSNLDPFGEHSDDECWEVLERCHLTSLLKRRRNGVEASEISLDMPISQGGSLSAGERQLVALARAVLRRTSIVVMDEATSQIDSNLDDQIQTTIREVLSDMLVITIAHRLKTIIDYDRILVLGGGEILEYDTPKALIDKPGGAFREMCRRSADWPILLGSTRSRASSSSS
ncbi:hypothetical protein JAAARDRAFT_29273 [Jaapia argillacea MUCL 33604]|uniref:P-loop containing nucleoside triphosphate hydrolase protein n=1 Tax=Jaapia argillacea MUCL 33604 TaxID=933084 RepID=A0A067QAR5_9AGAM|nr:hypothetical protein JAAARDRAFT_29273 [Jaapia argillacea MUCL 33604]